MGVINDTLESLGGYLFSIKRDTINGWYFLEVGLPKSWIYKGNDIIDCHKVEVDNWDDGNLLKIAPLVDGVTVDDLLKFTQLILDTNAKIAEKEQEFVDKVKMVKEKLNAEKDDFYKQLDDLKDKSFNTFDFKLATPPNTGEVKKSNEKRGPGRPKGSTNKTKETVEDGK